ncbi:CPBP family intramembrane metalloprotease [Candidatus Dojkabacteria bacterium]|jgi:membrane protease YdiL (CAAX protease family)|nr:CPBP family intramembrane metalloprotease [Candidatus Dojkabacteria bacterium]
MSHKNNVKKKDIIRFIIILLTYILTPILILLNPLFFKYKFLFLVIIGILIYLTFRLTGVTNAELGITKNKWKESIKDIIPFTLLLIVITIVLRTFGFQRFNPTETIYFYLFYLFISSPVQEFLYRSVFKYFETKKLFSPVVALILSSVLYSFVHIIYKDIFLLLITLVIGIIWYTVYGKTKNLLGVSISHAVLGILTIALGII